MCLMCEWYLDSCDKPECVEAARLRAEAYKALPDDHPDKQNRYSSIVEEYWNGKSSKYYLWKGYSDPCEHISEGHGPECELFDSGERQCNCDPHDDFPSSCDDTATRCTGLWHYYM